MKGKKANITEAEWPIMTLLWKNGSATAAEIVEEILRDRDISMRTVKSLITRLVAKGAVVYTVDPEDSRIYHYSAVIPREEAVREKQSFFLGTVFDNNPMNLLAHFVAESKLSPRDIASLESLLKSKREETDDA